MTDFKELSQQELIEYIQILEKRRKFGLVWNEEFSREENSTFVRESIPLLRPLEDLNIHDDSNDANVLIKGENIDALRILRFSHSKSFDVIYIDPPYNTGNRDFKYNDQWVDSEDPYRHSKWLTFMETRLKIAKELLDPEGLIFISIGDDEGARLQVLADQIFGEVNRIGPLIWFYEGVNDNNAYVKKTHEYILVYQASRDVELSKTLKDPNVELDDIIENSVVKNGPKNPPSSVQLPVGFPAYFKKGTIARDLVTSLSYSDDLVVEDFKLVNSVTVTSGWSSKGILNDFINSNFEKVLDSKGQLTEFGITSAGNINYRKNRDQSYVLSVLRNLGTVANAGADLKSRGIDFNYPKPVGLIKYLIAMHGNKDALVLDFFAGSGTTGEAVLSLNQEDGGKRSFILVTNNEGNIFDEVCYPRIESSIKGYSRKKEKVAGLGGRLVVYEVVETPRIKNPDEAAFRFAEDSIELIKLRHNNFDVRMETQSFIILANNYSAIGIFFDPDPANLEEFQREIAKFVQPKIVYLFSLASDGSSLADDINFNVQKIDFFPTKILSVLNRK